MTPYVLTAFMANSAISLFSVRAPTPEALRALNAAFSEAIIVTCEDSDIAPRRNALPIAPPMTRTGSAGEARLFERSASEPSDSYGARRR